MPLRCPRCGHASIVRSYDGVMCLLCGQEIVPQKESDTALAALIAVAIAERHRYEHKRGHRNKKTKGQETESA